MPALARALRAALFIIVHIFLALLIIAGIYAIQRGLLAIGDPRLFDLLPLRYIFDIADVCVLAAFVLFGCSEAYFMFRDDFRRARRTGGRR
jgi:hypothetical protein